MDTFLEIMINSGWVLAGLIVLGAALVFVANWLVDNSEEPHAH